MPRYCTRSIKTIWMAFYKEELKLNIKYICLKESYSGLWKTSAKRSSGKLLLRIFNNPQKKRLDNKLLENILHQKGVGAGLNCEIVVFFISNLSEPLKYNNKQQLLLQYLITKIREFNLEFPGLLLVCTAVISYTHSFLMIIGKFSIPTA